MHDTEFKLAVYEFLQRQAVALESIAESLAKAANPPVMARAEDVPDTKGVSPGGVAYFYPGEVTCNHNWVKVEKPEKIGFRYYCRHCGIHSVGDPWVKAP